MQSISRGFLLAIGATSVAITLSSSVVAFCVFRQQLHSQQERHLAEYLDERYINLSRRFRALAGVHAGAVSELRTAVAHLPPAEADRIFEARYPRRADGTRRSRPADFDGALGPDGDYVRGMGAFLSPQPSDPLERKTLAAAFAVVGRVGTGAHSSWDNLYFATPTNKLVMYAPDRPDHLLFYRNTAPATLDFSHEQMMRLVAPAADPSRAMRCTSLQRLLQARGGERLGVACLTPVYLDGRYVGAFGSSIYVGDFLAKAVRRTEVDASGLIAQSDGRVLAYPGVAEGQAVDPARAAEVARRFDLATLMPEVTRSGRPTGVVRDPRSGALVAFGRMEGPDWWYLLALPKSAADAQALASAGWILVLGLVSAALQAGLILRIARGRLVQPLEELALECAAGRAAAATRRIAQRDDELGVLARSLAAERDNAQLVMTSLEDRVGERTAELRRADQEKSRFLATMSQELRTPLNGILAVSEALAPRQAEPESRRMAEVIIDAGRRLEQVLGDMLDVASLDAGDVVIVPEPFDLTALIERTGEPHRAAAQAKGLELGWTVTPGARGRYLGDPVRLGQILANLLGNAVKFTDSGWVTVRVDRRPQGALRFVVSDTGTGFEPDVGERLFTRFDGPEAPRPSAYGTGLGLPISRSLARAMGGDITASSRPGVGSVFTFLAPLPAVPNADAATRPAADNAAEATPRSPLAGLRILVAEDHPVNQKLVALILGGAGVEPTIASDGRQMSDAFARSDFDAVLVDAHMPGADGLSALQTLHEQEAAAGGRRTPVIVMTAGGGKAANHANLAAGAAAVVAKPIRAADLLSTLERVLVGDPATDVAAA